MSVAPDGTGTPPAPVPAVAPSTQATPAPQSTETPAVDPAQGLDAGMAEARAAMGEGDAGTFLADFLASEGLAPAAPTPAALPPGQQPQVPLAPNGAVPVQQPGNAPTPGTAQPVDPALLQRLMQGPQAAPAPFAPVAPQWPQQPPAPVAYAPQPAPQGQQPPQDPNAIPVQFAEPFQIPDQMQQGLNHEDPRVRAQAIGAIMAAAGNTVFNRVVTFMRANDLPAVARATVGQVGHQQLQETVNRELYGNFPNLRFASPALIAQAGSVVIQDELARNPSATVTPQILQRIGALADAGMRQLAIGQAPTFAPVPAQAPQVNPGPAPAPVWNGQQWVMPPVAAPAYYAPQPQPPSIPWTTGASAQPFGVPGPTPVTPESEFAAFQAGQWGT